MDNWELENLARFTRYLILTSTTQSGSGHPTSCLSATDLMVGLLFGGVFRFDVDSPDFPGNDRLIFSKGHAAPLLYALWAATESIEVEELRTLRQFGSRLEGHPTLEFPFTEAATGSLGQGLSIGLGMALNAKYLDKLGYRTYVLLGDSEMSEGSNWEAMQIAAHYKLDNLVGVVDVNRLGQRGETMYGHDVDAYQKRASSFGWEAILVDGHSFEEILAAYNQSSEIEDRPTLIIAKTIKGKGVSFLEDQQGWHGSVLSADEIQTALRELGNVDLSIRGELTKPQKAQSQKPSFDPFDRLKVTLSEIEGSKVKSQSDNLKVKTNENHNVPLATRKAFGRALVKLFPKYPNMVVLDAEVSNSTYSETFKKAYPDRFFEMFIAEQNMVGVAVGLAVRGKIPFVSTFAAFLTRAFDQIRMAALSRANIKVVGSHGGVSIGEDGPSQMGLEDIAMFRSLPKSVILYPADFVSCEKLVEATAKHQGMTYLRTTRMDTPPIYKAHEDFEIGGSKTLKESKNDQVTVVAAGIALHESLEAYEKLKEEGIKIRVIDLYSIKPLDQEALVKAVSETEALITVEDHYLAGGVGEAVRSVLEGVRTPIYSLAVQKVPRSGRPEELLSYEGISADAIVRKVKDVI